MTLVFVYGTLMRGYGNHRFLEGAELIAAGVELPGFRMLDLGPFPAITPQPPGEPTATVIGELYRVDTETLRALDRLEGHPHFYQRRTVAVTLSPEKHTRAQTYVMTAGRLERQPTVHGGSWRTHRPPTIWACN